MLDNQGQPSTAKGNGLGFGWAPDGRPFLSTLAASNVTYTNCVAEDCQVGFDTWFHINGVWDNISAPGCETDVLVQTNPPAKRVLFADPIAESNPPLWTPLVNVARDNEVKNLRF